MAEMPAWITSCSCTHWMPQGWTVSRDQEPHLVFPDWGHSLSLTIPVVLMDLPGAGTKSEDKFSHLYLWQAVWPAKPGMQSWSCRSWASQTAEGSSTAEQQLQRSYWTDSHFISLISQWYFNYSGLFELEISSRLIHNPANHTDLFKVKL